MTPNHKSDLDWARSLGVGSTLRQLWYDADWRCHVVLLLSPLLLTTWKYFCSYQALNENLPEQILFVEKNSQIVELIHFALSFLLWVAFHALSFECYFVNACATMESSLEISVMASKY